MNYTFNPIKYGFTGSVIVKTGRKKCQAAVHLLNMLRKPTLVLFLAAGCHFV